MLLIIGTYLMHGLALAYFILLQDYKFVCNGRVGLKLKKPQLRGFFVKEYILYTIL